MPRFKRVSDGREVTGEQFDGSAQMSALYGLKFGLVPGEGECWWSVPTGAVRVGTWIVTGTESSPHVYDDALFRSWYREVDAQAEQQSEQKRLHDLETELASLRAEVANQSDAARRARAELLEVRRMQELAAVPPLPEKVDWYSCVICSFKSDEQPAHRLDHACCRGAALVGPCCRKAVELSRDVVEAVMKVSGHVRPCTR